MYSTAFSILVVILLMIVPSGSVMTAADAPASAGITDNAPSLPVKTACKKVDAGENKGLYELKVTNVSDHALTVTTTVRVSVPVHNQPKIRQLPPQVIDSGKSWTIDALAAHDVITLVAAGFAPLEITVP